MADAAARKLYDIIVVGGGFAGLSAAMNAASENRTVLLLEGGESLGGQGGSTNRILNLFGFPDGISGAELTNRAIKHLDNRGADYRVHKQAIRLEKHPEGPFTVFCDDNSQFHGRTVIAACGLKYRELEVPGEQRYKGRGISYGFPEINNELWRDRRVVVVGGGNSGAQACLFLTDCNNCHVTFVVRGGNLAKSMSGMYLPHFTPGKIPNLDILLGASVQEIRGDDSRVSEILLKLPNGSQSIKMDHACVMVGGSPHTGWLSEIASLDKFNFILTDRDLAEDTLPLFGRKPLHCETNVPGLFAVGDVRAGNDRRRATSAANEGMQGAASAVQYLDDLNLLLKLKDKVAKVA